jgi:DNA-binding response OmpR family regulator/MinD-like ATPase involved in chromosome partitioning or flagellar assembly
MAKKILIIEADPTALRLTEYTLKQRGHQVITTCNGLEGILTAQKEAPDLIILDVMLPGIDGYEVCKRLRTGAQTADIPILIISGKAREEDIAIGFKAGANDYLPKPATPSTIISRAERLLAVKPDGQLGIIAFINSSNSPGMTVLLSEIAAAITEAEKQVTLVEVVSAQKGPKNQAAAHPSTHGRAIMETTTGNTEKTEPACEVLPSGIRILHITESAEGDDVAANSSIELMQNMSGATDYLLVDLPFNPTNFTKSVLATCELAVIASGYRLKDISEIHNITNLLNFSGISPAKTAAILIDAEGTFPAASLSSIKPYFEANLGIDLAGVISFDAKLYQLSYLESQPIIRSGQNSQFAQNIRQIAHYILSHNSNKMATLKPIARVAHLEKGK